MKQLIVFLATWLIAFTAAAQNRVKLDYSAKKIADKTYELHITATIDDDWHLYSQQSDEKGGRPAAISFTNNPLATLSGGVKEVGRLKSRFEELFGVTVKYYEKKVDFVQVVKLKADVKTNVTGTISYMICSDRECMPPISKKFSFAL